MKTSHINRWSSERYELKLLINTLHFAKRKAWGNKGHTRRCHLLRLHISNQGCQTWDSILRSWEFFKPMGYFLGFNFPKKTVGSILGIMENVPDNF